ncbi:Hypothetical_protein [Hexamita inflata]|uniref:Hypothetical_protein n=1 Tax=Hexamita inflata TaxID=28002 RepID=A0AA86TEL5_9EUKA|nr:Hypothetical protein HINF_LOCUS4229 [Hexamita inflata]
MIMKLIITKETLQVCFKSRATQLGSYRLIYNCVRARRAHEKDVRSPETDAQVYNPSSSFVSSPVVMLPNPYYTTVVFSFSEQLKVKYYIEQQTKQYLITPLLVTIIYIVCNTFQGCLSGFQQ